MDGAADNHYPTMTLAARNALKLPAAEYCNCLSARGLVSPLARHPERKP